MKFKKYIFLTIVLFLFIKTEAQDYQFLSGIQGQDLSIGIMVNKDSMVFWPIRNTKRQSDFDIKILSKNKYLANYHYQYAKNKSAFFALFKSLYLNDTTIIFVGSSNIIPSEYGDNIIIVLDNCLRPKKIFVFKSKEIKYGSIINIIKIDEKTVLLTMGASGNTNVFIPFDIEKGELVLKKQIKLRVSKGEILKIKDKFYHFGKAFREINDSVGSQSSKAHMAIFDTSGNLFWEKLYILNEPKQFYDGRDFVQINNNPDFLLFMGDYQSKKSKPTESGGIRVVKIDSSFNIKWKKNITDSNHFEWVYKAAKINNNRYLILGTDYPLKSSNQIECAKLTLIDSNAEVIKTYSFPCRTSGNTRVIFSFQHHTIDYDGNILIAGQYYDEKNSTTSMDAFLVKIKPDLSIAQQKPDNRIYYNACGEQWKDTTFELPEPIIIPINLDSLPRSIAPVYSVGPGTTASIEKTKTGDAKAIIYPNPTSDFLEFYSEDFKQINTVNFEIYNSIGQLVLSQKHVEINNGKFTIHVKELAAGNYHLKVSGKEQIVNFKFVVE